MASSGGPVMVENMIKLNELDEDNILKNLQIRFDGKQIYTYVGTVLISINPYKLLPLYGEEVLNRYHNYGAAEEPPHVYAVADTAYRAMCANWRDQSILVSGESGAGKTEATKQLLAYLTEMSARVRGPGQADGERTLEKQCMFAQVVLEAFGNAKTVRNDNSSRFGKWIEVQFSARGTIEGALIRTYLLEKSRVVKVDEGERTYHCFYELLAHAAQNPDLAARLHLGGGLQAFHYIRQSSVTTIPDRDDAEYFDSVSSALRSFGVTSEEMDGIWGLVAGILHLGNIEFEFEAHKSDADDADGSKVVDPAPLALAAELLQVPVQDLEKALTFHSYGSRSIIYIPNKPEEAEDARDALAKALYAGMFNWLGQKINRVMHHTHDDECKTMGILDIFGFEVLKTNSFEQLCINYCNEKLQFHFNEECFRIEQEEYRQEGLSLEDVPYTDNQACIDLLEQRPAGIFQMIDEEIWSPGGSNLKLLDKLFQQHAKHPHLVRPRPREGTDCFKVVHYAGDVLYKTEGLMEKSKDSLHPDLEQLGALSGSRLVLEALEARSQGAVPAEYADPGDPGASGQGSKPRGGKTKLQQPTLGTQFSSQLRELLAKLNATEPHFIKCLKPNTLKAALSFVDDEVMTQLRYTGIFGLCKLRKIGFSHRPVFAEFFARYRCLKPASRELRELLDALAGAGILKHKLWLHGKTKVLMKYEQYTHLEAEVEAFRKRAIVIMQRHARGVVTRGKYRRLVAARLQLLAAMRARDEAGLAAALQQVRALPGPWARRVPEEQAALQLMERLRAERECTAACEAATAARELAPLEAAVGAADAMSPPFTSPVVEAARQLLARVREEVAAMGALRQAGAAQDLAGLQEALGRCRALELGGAEVEAGGALAAALAGLPAAVQARSRGALEAALSAADAAGVRPDLQAPGRQLLARLLEEEACLAALRAAVQARDAAALDAMVAEAGRLQLGGAEVQHAQALSQQLAAEQAARESYAAAVAQQSAAAVQASLEQMESLGMPAPDGSEAVLQRLREEEAKAARLEQLRSDLVAAMQSKDKAAVDTALAAATAGGLTGPQVDTAVALLAQLGDMQKAEAARVAAAAAAEEAARAERDSAKAAQMESAAAAAAAAQSSTPGGGGAGPKDDTFEIDLKGEGGEAEAAAAAAGGEAAAAAAGGVGPASPGAGTRARDDLTAAIKHAVEMRDYPSLQKFVTNAERLEMDFPELAEARAILAAGPPAQQQERQAELVAEVQGAMEARDYDRLREAVDKCGELGVDAPEVQQARTLLAIPEPSLPQAGGGGEGGDGAGGATGSGGPASPQGRPSQSDTLEIMKIAAKPKWRLELYARLRSPDDFAKSKLLNKKKAMEGMLTFTKDTIPNSLVNLPTDLAKTAIGAHRALLSFTGLKKVDYPATSGQTILRQGVLHEELRDELYLQICKHLTGNTVARSMRSAWCLLCMCVDAFSPTVEFELYLLHWLMKQETDPQWGNYARYCLTQLVRQFDMEEEEVAQAARRRELPRAEFIDRVLAGELEPYVVPSG